MTTVVNEAELAVDHLRETERASALGGHLTEVKMRRPVGHRITPVAITPNATAAPTMATARALIRWWVISFYEPIAVSWDVTYSTRR
jgi:hypothetical protein